MAKPFRVDLELTRRCNQQCIHCMVNALPRESETDEIPLSSVVTILKELARQGVFIVHFTGGEPTLRNDLGKCLLTARDLGYCILLSTNGTLLNEKIIQTIVKSRAKVEVSLDGATSAVHDRIRGKPGSFNEVIKGTEQLSKFGCDFAISTVMLKDNLHQLEKIVDLAGKLGAQKVFLKLPRLVGRAYHSREELCAPYNSITQTIKKIRLKSASSSNIPKIIFPVLPLYQGHQDEGKTFTCPAGISKIGILADGTVVPCLLLRQTLGKLPEVRLAELLNHPYIKQIWNVQIHGSPQCKGCEHQKNCRAGCRAAAIVSGGDINGRDPLCEIYGKGK